MSNQVGSQRQALANARAIRNQKIQHLEQRIKFAEKMQTQLRAAHAIGHKVCEAMLGRSLDTMAGECAAKGTDQIYYAIEHLASKIRELKDQLASYDRMPVTAVDPSVTPIREPGRTVTAFLIDESTMKVPDGKGNWVHKHACPPGCTCRGTRS